MDLHDFPLFIGKSGCVSHPPTPKFWAGLVALLAVLGDLEQRDALLAARAGRERHPRWNRARDFGAVDCVQGGFSTLQFCVTLPCFPAVFKFAPHPSVSARWCGSLREQAPALEFWVQRPIPSVFIGRLLTCYFVSGGLASLF